MLKNIIKGTLVLVTIGVLGSCTDQKQKNNSSEKVKVTILQTADIHGQLLPHDELFWENDSISFKKLGGLAYIKTIFDQEKTKNPEGTVILDGGDLIQGSAVAALSKGSAFPAIISQMGYDFLIPGNWEVVYGKQIMLDVMNNYQTEVIAANMENSNDSSLLFKPYTVKEINGVKLGFLSYNDPEIPVRQNPSFSKGIAFNPIAKNVKKYIKELKEDHKVDVLFLVTHIGISKQYELSNNPDIKGVDYILGNDTHERIRKPLKGKYAKLVEPGAFGSFVGKLELTIQNHKIISENYELIEVDTKKFKPNPEIAAIIEKELTPFKETTNKILGYSSTPLYRYFVVENPMDNFITDAARWKTGADISISNGFRFSPPLVPDTSGKVAIKQADIWNMLPVNEKVKTGEVTGQQITNWLEQELHNVFSENLTERFGGWLVRFSGMEITFNANAPKGERIQSILIHGEPLVLDKTYTMSACRREGEPLSTLCRMPNVKNAKVMDYTIHDVIAEYLHEKGTINPKMEGRAKALDLGDNVLSQLPGTNYHFH